MSAGAPRVHVQDAERDQVQEHDGGDDEDAERHAGVLADAEDVEARDAPDDAEDERRARVRRPIGQERRPVDHGAHRRDAGGQDVVDHDRRDGHERRHRPEHEVRERVDAAAADVVLLEDAARSPPCGSRARA